MRQDVYGDVRAALKASLRFSTLYGVAGQHKKGAGRYFMPQGYYNDNTSGFTTTADRLYYFPFAIEDDVTIVGVSVRNTDTSASGHKARFFVFDNSVPLSSGPPLAKDFGEITFGATAVENQLTSTWAAPRGCYWGAYWAKNATAVQYMFQGMFISAAGFITPPTLTNIHGIIGFTGSTSNQFGYDYLSLAYGATPATAPAPTSTDVSGLGQGNKTIPQIWFRT